MRTLRLQAVLREVVPPVQRVLDVPASTTLPELHELLQAGFGWTDSHLHQFETPDAVYGPILPGQEVDPPDQRDENRVTLADLGDTFNYRYDFGDNWNHHSTLLGRGDPVPGCVDGYGSCPPEDCGGPGGYTELLDALYDPGHPDHDHMSTWVGTRLRPFDQVATDTWVKHVVGTVPESVSILLQAVAGGVRLTPGARLPRTIVRHMQQHRPHWQLDDRPATLEEDLYPLLVLHGVLRTRGLLQLRHGVLAPTKAADNDLAVVRRLRTLYEPHTFTTVLTELTTASLAAHGPIPVRELGSRIFALLGPGWVRDGAPLTAFDVQLHIEQQRSLMSALDLIDTSDRTTWAAGPSAQSLLPRTALLTHTWTS